MATTELFSGEAKTQPLKWKTVLFGSVLPTEAEMTPTL
jgi:hypothetical protein